MANLGEIDEAVNVAREAGAEDIVLLHCTSGYPTKPDEADILTIPNLIDAFGLVTGLSDHAWIGRADRCGHWVRRLSAYHLAA